MDNQKEVTVRLPATTKKRLDMLCIVHDMNRQQLVATLISQAYRSANKAGKIEERLKELNEDASNGKKPE